MQTINLSLAHTVSPLVFALPVTTCFGEPKYLGTTQNIMFLFIGVSRKQLNIQPSMFVFGIMMAQELIINSLQDLFLFLFTQSVVFPLDFVQEFFIAEI